MYAQNLKFGVNPQTLTFLLTIIDISLTKISDWNTGQDQGIVTVSISPTC